MPSSLIPHGSPPAYLTFASLAALGLPHATTTRPCPGVASFAEPISAASPVSPFRADAIRTLAAAGLDLRRVGYAKQIHGAEAAQAPAGGGFAGTVDVLVSVEPRTHSRSSRPTASRSSSTTARRGHSPRRTSAGGVWYAVPPRRPLRRSGGSARAPNDSTRPSRRRSARAATKWTSR